MVKIDQPLNCTAHLIQLVVMVLVEPVATISCSRSTGSDQEIQPNFKNIGETSLKHER